MCDDSLYVIVSVDSIFLFEFAYLPYKNHFLPRLP